MILRGLLPLLIVLASVGGCRADDVVRAGALSALELGEARWQSIAADPKYRTPEHEGNVGWPLHAALREAAPAGYHDCSLDSAPLACMAEARQTGNTAVLIRLGFGEDSMIGWAVLQHRDGSLMRYAYDSSPCGGIEPSACGYRLERSACEAVSALQPDPSQQRALCDKPYFGAKRQ